MTDGPLTCAQCGNANAAGRRFCDACGAPLVAQCGSCGAQNRPGARFCGDCGAALEGADATTPPTIEVEPGAPPIEPRSPALSAPERRLVSVLFVDLVGFTPYAETRDPEEVRETLDTYFELARSIVDRYGGAIEKFIGDAVMAVWGTPVAHEDDAERAVRAALDLVAAVPRLGDGIGARGGIMTGEAAVDREARGQAMVAGDLVNTAARLQGAAAPGTVLVGDATVRAASEAIAFESTGEQTLKGKSAPLATWRALRVVAQRRGAGRATGLEPPFVGRDEELRLLKELLHATGRDHRPRLVSVMGPAGIGKSRLAWELEKYIDGIVEGVWWHHGRSPAYGDGITFWALVEIVRGRCGLVEGDDEATIRAKLAAALDQHVAVADDRARVEPALLALLGLEAPPAGGREVLFEAWRTFFERIGDTGTTVLVFEDLQWADPGLIDFVEYLHEWSRGVPLLIVTLARPELFDRRASWGAGKRNFSALVLEPIPAAAMRALLSGLVPELPEAAVEAIVVRADGVPLYAVEFVRSLVGAGRLAEDGAVLRPIGDLTDLAMPESLRSLVAARLDGLDETDRALLQDAAVLGRSFTPQALAGIRGVEPADVEPRLVALTRREILVQDVDPRSPERGQFSFVQALIREVAYETLARRERRARHLAAARYFETLGGSELADALAEHYLAAHAASAPGQEADAVSAQARLALGAAADRALALGSPEQALARLEQAIRITPDGGARLDLLDRAADAASQAGRYDRAETLAREAVAGRAGTADPVAAAQSTNLLATAVLESGQAPSALDLIEAAIAELNPDVEPAAEAALRATRARCLYRLSRNDEAAAEGMRAIALAEKLDDVALIAEAMANTAGGVVQAAQPHLGIALLRQAVDLAEATGQVRLALRCRSNLAVATRALDQAAAIPAFEDVLAAAQRIGDRGIVAWASSHLADLLMVTDLDWERALDLSNRAGEEADAAFDRALNMPGPILIAAYRGEPVGTLLKSFDELVEPLGDVFARTLARMTRLIADFTADDPQGALVTALAAAADPEKLMAFTLVVGMWAAARLDDRVAFTTLRARTTDIEWFSPKLQSASEALFDAFEAVLDGRPEQGAARFGAALDSLRSFSEVLGAADVGLMFIELIPDRLEAVAAARESRAIYAKVRARPLIARVDAALAVRRVASPTVGPAVAGEAV